MEVSKGYKRTEVGEIPDDWSLISYDDAFSFHSTASFPREDLGENGEVFYVHYGDIHTKWRSFLDFSKNNLPTIDSKQAKGYPNLEEGDSIIVDASEDYEGVGSSVEVKNIGNKKAISGLHTFLLKDKKETFVNGFKGYIHSNKIVKKQFDKLATGLKVYGVSRGNLKKVLIPLPPTKEEQTAIAKVLGDTDELISSLENLIEKKKLIKQGAMQQLLTGKKRLPGFSGKWERISVGAVTKFHKQGYYTKEQYKEGGKYFLLRGTDMLNPRIDLSTTPKVNANEFDYKSYKVEKNDVLIVRSGAIGRYGIVKDIPDSIFGSYLILFRFDQQKLDNNFFGYFYQSESSIGQLMTITQGSSNININAENIKSLTIPIPPTIDEQKAISQIFMDLDLEITKLEQKLTKYKNIKQGMMQVLLTGKIRLV